LHRLAAGVVSTDAVRLAGFLLDAATALFCVVESTEAQHF
jgi:hypothetical protein